MLTSTERAYEIIAKDIIGLTNEEYKIIADDIDNKKAFHIKLPNIPSNALFSNNPTDATVFDIKSIATIEKDDNISNKATRVLLSKSINASKQLYGYVDERGNQKPGLFSGIRKWKDLDNAGKKQAYEKLKFYQKKATDSAIFDGKKGWDNKWLQAASIYASALELPDALSAQQIWKLNVEREGGAVWDNGAVIPGDIPYFNWDPIIEPIMTSTIVDSRLGEEAFKATNKAIENAEKDFITQSVLASSGNKITEASDKETQDFNINQISGFENLR